MPARKMGLRFPRSYPKYSSELFLACQHRKTGPRFPRSCPNDRDLYFLCRVFDARTVNARVQRFGFDVVPGSNPKFPGCEVSALANRLQ